MHMLSKYGCTELCHDQLATFIPQQPIARLAAQVKSQLVNGYIGCPTEDIVLELLLASLRRVTPGMEESLFLNQPNDELRLAWAMTLNEAHGLKLDKDCFCCAAYTPYRLAIALNAQLCMSTGQ